MIKAVYMLTSKTLAPYNPDIERSVKLKLEHVYTTGKPLLTTETIDAWVPETLAKQVELGQRFTLTLEVEK
jgi:hypothetical protein